MLFLRATCLMLSFILVGLAPWNQPAFAAAGDDPASVIATRTGPGETTSQSCGSNGFIMVSFFLGSVLVSSIESGTTCSGGGGGGASNATAPDVQSQLEQDLLAVQSQRLADRLLDQLGQTVQAFETFEEQNGAASAPGETDRKALLSEYQADLALELKNLASLSAKANKLEQQVRELRANMSALEASVDNAREQRNAARDRLANTKAAAANSPTGRVLAAAKADLDSINKEIENWQDLSSSNYENADYANNKLAAARIRARLAATVLLEAQDAHREALAKVTDSEVAYNNSEAHLQDSKNALAQNHEQISSKEEDVARIHTEFVPEAHAEIYRLEALIAALNQRNQFAGPSAGPFDALNTRGLEFWSRGSYFDIEDNQAGRVQDVEQKELTVGVQARVSERTIVGLAVSYSNVENVDQTGVAISTDSDAIFIAPYFAYQLSEDLAVDVGAVYGHTEIDVTRALAATGSYDSDTYGGQIGVSMRHRLSTVIELTGRVGQSYVFTESSGYTDTGGATVASSNSEQATSSLAGRINVTTDPDWRWFATTQLQYQAIDPGNGIDRLHGGLASGLEYDAGSFSVLGQVSRSIFWSNYQATGLTLQVRVPL